MNSIVLIGMPGAGKSRLGQAAAELLGMKFIDLDCVIEKRFGAISDLFAQGEALFRDRETQALREIAREAQHIVLATGGGIVLKEENVQILKAFGTVVYIRRSIDAITKSISQEGRPWLQGNYREKLEKRYHERRNLYEQAADVILENEDSVEISVGQIIRIVSGD